jgi:hypothetical protein
LRRVHLRFPPVKVPRAFSSRATNWKWARLRGGTMSQFLSTPLQSGFRFLQSPLPATPSAFLADTPAPKPGRNVGFTRLDCTDTNELAPVRYTGSLECPCASVVRRSRRLRCHFGRSLSASLAPWLLRCLKQFTCVGHFTQPVLPTALTLAVAGVASRQSPHRDDGRSLSRWLLTRPLPVAPAPIGYCGRNRRFASCFHVEPSLQSHFSIAPTRQPMHQTCHDSCAGAGWLPKPATRWLP